MDRTTLGRGVRTSICNWTKKIQLHFPRPDSGNSTSSHTTGRENSTSTFSRCDSEIWCPICRDLFCVRFPARGFASADSSLNRKARDASVRVSRLPRPRSPSTRDQFLSSLSLFMRRICERSYQLVLLRARINVDLLSAFIYPPYSHPTFFSLSRWVVLFVLSR